MTKKYLVYCKIQRIRIVRPYNNDMSSDENTGSKYGVKKGKIPTINSHKDITSTNGRLENHMKKNGIIL